MSVDALLVLDPGLGATIQDLGRFGWRRFGVPPSGAMDDHAAAMANRLLQNPLNAPVLELLLQSARLEVLQDCWLAITGAETEVNCPMWQAVRVQAGEVLHFRNNQSGIWIYVAVEGGWVAENMLGSASVYPRGRLGQPLSQGARLQRHPQPAFHLPEGVARSFISASERRVYTAPKPLRVWPGPQWHHFSAADRSTFFSSAWTVTAQSDRVGYRLNGKKLFAQPAQIISEPVRVGSIQIPQNGEPIITMRDGPTVGGYPKIGMIDAQDLSWLAQCRPGQQIRFEAVA